MDLGRWRLDSFGLRNPVNKCAVSPCAVREIAAQFIRLLLVHEELRRKVDERTTTGLVTFAPLLIKANFFPVPFLAF